MPLKYFDCPDNIRREVVQCLSSCPRKEGRCLSMPTLTELGYSRDWTGTPSTTQLLNPTRYEYLKIIHDYAINPFERAFALLGTRHHKRLESVAKRIEGLIAEKKLVGEVTGIVDLIEPDNTPETWRLIDYKTWGSFALAKIISENGNDFEKHHAALQLNNYRLMLNDLGFVITSLFVQATIRDGGTFMARKNGIEAKMMLVPIPILPDDIVREYFLTKAFALQITLDKKQLPELCEYQERWEGRRCKAEYCEIHAFCPEGAKINRVTLEE